MASRSCHPYFTGLLLPVNLSKLHVLTFSGILVYFLVLALVYTCWSSGAVPQSLLYWALAAAVLLRLFLLPAIPELSDDFYRFIWDGRLLNQGISPFAELPSTLMQDARFSEDPVNQQLFLGMNSPDYFTVYPPLAQWIFFVASWLFPDDLLGNLMVMRLVIILFEIGTIILCLKILKQSGLPTGNVLIYAWNPLVVVELTGNLHFEAVMIFFVLLAVYLWQINRWKWSASALAAGVAAKLIPLIFLPLLMLRKPWKQVVRLLDYLWSGDRTLVCHHLEPGISGRYAFQSGLVLSEIRIQCQYLLSGEGNRLCH